MAHAALQRVMVRMLYDSAFAARVLGEPGAALAGTGLTGEEAAWLRAPDPRAWGTDPERPVRALNILLQQYPTACALAARGPEGGAGLLEFFRSRRFHDAVQGGGSMALAFGAFLAERVEAGAIPDRRTAPLAELERAIVELRRGAPPGAPAAPAGAIRFRLSPDKAVCRAPAGTADLHEQVHAALARAGTGLPRAVLSPAMPLPTLAPDPGESECLLLELVRDDGPRVRYPVGVTEITEGLHDLLVFAGEPRGAEALAAEIVRLGADPSEAPELIEGLAADGTLAGAD